jgi:exocyst complex component 7
MMEDNILNAESIIRKLDLTTSSSSDYSIHNSKNTPQLFTDEENNNGEAQEFINAIKDLQTAMRFLVKSDSSSEFLIRAQNLMEMAMKILEREFYTILKTKRSFLDSESISRASTWSSFSDFENEENSSEDDIDTPKTSNSENYGKASEIAMSNLKSIADCMISAGYGKECVYIYKLIRKSIIDETLYYFGVEKLSSSQIQKMDWDGALEVKVKKWLTAVKTAVKTLFHGERILCDHVFSSSDKIRESCFSEIVKENALTLFAFPEHVAKSKKILSPEKMFRFLDVYETISNLWIQIEVIFSFDSLSIVKSQAMTSLLKLGEAIRTMLSQFESAIQKDSSKAAVPGGGVHPLTRYVMNYLVFMADYSGSLADIVSDWPMEAQTPLPESYFSSPRSVHGIDEDSPASTITARLAWIILILLCKLDGKAGYYKEQVAESYLFLANNLNYVVSKVRSSNLSMLIGLEWISKHESKVKQYAVNYERMAWSKVMASLPNDPTNDISLVEVKDCFRRFNAGFEEAYRIQSSWVITDSKLQIEVKKSLAKTIIPRYRVFYERYRGVLGRELQLEPIVRFAPQDLENYLSNLFFASGSESTVTTATMSYVPSSSSSISSISSSRGQHR